MKQKDKLFIDFFEKSLQDMIELFGMQWGIRKIRAELNLSDQNIGNPLSKGIYRYLKRRLAELEKQT